jgi:hypothetical protein
MNMELGFRQVLGHTSTHPHRFPVEIWVRECRIKSGNMLMQAPEAGSERSKVGVIVAWVPFECLGRVKVHPLVPRHLLPPNDALWSSSASKSRNRHHTGTQSSGGTINPWGDRPRHSGEGNRCYMRSWDPPALILELFECEDTCDDAEKHHDNGEASPGSRLTQQKGGGIRNIWYP